MSQRRVSNLDINSEIAGCQHTANLGLLNAILLALPGRIGPDPGPFLSAMFSLEEV